MTAYQYNCPTCGQFTSPEIGFCDYDWSHSYPTHTAYCNKKCADIKRTEIGPEIVRQIESDMSELEEKFHHEYYRTIS